MKVTLKSGCLVRSTARSVGWDIHSAEDKLLVPGEVAVVRTGVVTEMTGCFALILDRSGLAAKYGVSRRAGVIDPDYDREWGCVLVNEGKEAYQVRTGDRIAQVVFLPLVDIPVVGAEVAAAMREGGFGSTGI